MKRKSNGEAPEKISFPSASKTPITTQLRRWSERLREDGFGYVANEINVFGHEVAPFPHTAGVEIDQTNPAGFSSFGREP